LEEIKYKNKFAFVKLMAKTLLVLESYKVLANFPNFFVLYKLVDSFVTGKIFKL
jgi:hypothetical protein